MIRACTFPLTMEAESRRFNRGMRHDIKALLVSTHCASYLLLERLPEQCQKACELAASHCRKGEWKRRQRVKSLS